MTRTELHRYFDQLTERAIEPTGRLLKQIAEGEIDPDRGWFWTREWRAGEREADEDLASGRFQRFDGDDAFLAHITRAELVRLVAAEETGAQ